MRPPAPGARLWWSSGGDVLAACPDRGARRAGLDEARRVLVLHRTALATASLGAERAFHAAHAAQLADAIAAAARWRRAALPCRPVSPVQS